MKEALGVCFRTIHGGVGWGGEQGEGPESVLWTWVMGMWALIILFYLLLCFFRVFYYKK